jgi:hypothetical protein
VSACSIFSSFFSYFPPLFFFAYVGAHEQELALSDLAAAAKADPNNATVRQELQNLRRQMSQQKTNDKQQVCV